MIELDNETRSSIVNRFGMRPNDDNITTSRESIIALSNSFTTLQNAFNAIQTHTNNVKKIQKAVIQGTKVESTETRLENPSAQLESGASASGAGGIESLLPQITQALEQLGKSVEELDLSASGQSTGGMGMGRRRGPSLKTMGKIGLGVAAVGAVGYGAYSLMSGDDEEEPKPKPKTVDVTSSPTPTASPPVAPASARVSGPAAEQSKNEKATLKAIDKAGKKKVAEKEDAPQLTPNAKSYTENLLSSIQGGVRSAGNTARTSSQAMATAVGQETPPGGDGGGEYVEASGGTGAWAKDTAFIEGINNVSRKFNVDGNDLLGLMQSESGINPQARNKSGATGLIQFMPATARGIGTSTDDLYNMNRAQQMPWVDRFFSSVRLPRGASAGHLYTSVFLPAYANKPSNFVVARQGGANDAGANKSGSWYSQNSGLDLNKDGQITIAELGQRVSKKRQEIGLGPSRGLKSGSFAAAAFEATTGGGGGGGANVGGFGGGASGGGSKGIPGKDIKNTDNINQSIKGKNIWDYARKNGSGIDYDGLKPGMKNRFLAMAMEYKQKTGNKVAINSANRTYAKQAALFKKYGANRAAPPGRSKHESGVAIDINSTDGNTAHKLGLLRKYGFFRPYPSEAWHVEPIEAAKVRGQNDNPYNPGSPIAQTGKGSTPVVQNDSGKTKQITEPSRQLGPPSEGIAIQQNIAGCECPATIIPVPVGGGGPTPGPAQYLAGVPSIKMPKIQSRNPVQEYRAYFNAA